MRVCFFSFLSSFSPTKVESHWSKTECCLFSPIKATITLHHQPNSSLALITLWVPPSPSRKKKKKQPDEIIIQGVLRCVSEIHIWVSQKTRGRKKKSLNLVVKVPLEPFPATSRHKAEVMASHRWYAELFWRFTQWTSATASAGTYTLPLCDVEVTVVEMAPFVTLYWRVV